MLSAIAPEAVDGDVRRPGHGCVLHQRVRIALEQARANEAEIDAILTPSQRIRLRQIALQAEGAQPSGSRKSSRHSGLHPGQRERIRAIEEENLFNQMREMNSGKAAEATGKTAMERIEGVLDCRAGATHGSEMAGEPIRGTLNAFPTPFRHTARPAADDSLRVARWAGTRVRKKSVSRTTRTAGMHLYLQEMSPSA